MTNEKRDMLAAAWMAEIIDAEVRKVIVGPVHEQRMTALRVRGQSFETVEINDDGLVIEPVRCTCRWAVIADYNCPLHKGGGIT